MNFLVDFYWKRACIGMNVMCHYSSSSSHIFSSFINVFLGIVFLVSVWIFGHMHVSG